MAVHIAVHIAVDTLYLDILGILHKMSRMFVFFFDNARLIDIGMFNIITFFSATK